MMQIEGIIYVVRTQSNMRIHILVALGVLAGAILLGASRVELGILLYLTIAAVMVAEMINTADRVRP